MAAARDGGQLQSWQCEQYLIYNSLQGVHWWWGKNQL
jgi:hypothetical protein